MPVTRTHSRKKKRRSGRSVKTTATAFLLSFDLAVEKAQLGGEETKRPTGKEKKSRKDKHKNYEKFLSISREKNYHINNGSGEATHMSQE